MTDLARTSRSRVKRLPKRGGYDFDTVAAILDAGFLCQLLVTEGQLVTVGQEIARIADSAEECGS